MTNNLILPILRRNESQNKIYTSKKKGKKKGSGRRTFKEEIPLRKRKGIWLLLFFFFYSIRPPPKKKEDEGEGGGKEVGWLRYIKTHQLAYFDCIFLLICSPCTTVRKFNTKKVLNLYNISRTMRINSFTTVLLGK